MVLLKPTCSLEDKMANCEHLVLRCMDPRMNCAVLQFLQNLGLKHKDYFLLSQGGGVFPLVGLHHAKSLIDDIRLAVVNGVKNIILISHEDCVKYGGSSAYESREKEMEFQVYQLNLAATFLKNMLPRTEVMKVYAERFLAEGEDVFVLKIV